MQIPPIGALQQLPLPMGGSSDMWGLALTPAIKSTNAEFRRGRLHKIDRRPLIALLLEGGIDYISIALTYNTPATSLAITLDQFFGDQPQYTDVLNWTATSNDAGDKFVVKGPEILRTGRTWPPFRYRRKASNIAIRTMRRSTGIISIACIWRITTGRLFPHSGSQPGHHQDHLLSQPGR